jgi:hypothetical protein
MGIKGIGIKETGIKGWKLRDVIIIGAIRMY